MKTSVTLRSKAITLFILVQLIGITYPCSALEYYYTILSSPRRVQIGVRAVAEREDSIKLTAGAAGEATHILLDSTNNNFTFLCAKEGGAFGNGKGSSNFFTLYGAQRATNYFMASEYGEYVGSSTHTRTAPNGSNDHCMQKRIYYGITGWQNPQMVGAEIAGQEYFSDSTDGAGVRHVTGSALVRLTFESHGINEGFLTWSEQAAEHGHSFTNDPPSPVVGSIGCSLQHFSWGTNFPTTWNYTNDWYTNTITHTNTDPFVITNSKSELIQMPYMSRIVAISNFSTFNANSNYYGYLPQVQTNSGGYFRVRIGDPEFSSGTKRIQVTDQEPVFFTTNLVQTFEDPVSIGYAFTRPDTRVVAWYGTNAATLNAQGVTEERQALPNLGSGYQITGTNGSPGMNWSLVGYVDTFEVIEASPSLAEFLAAFGYSAIEDPDADSAKIQNFCFQIATKLGTCLDRKEIWKENE